MPNLFVCSPLLRRRSVLLCLGAIGATGSALAQPAAVMLANVYRPGLALPDYWVSEKYDGVRGYWDGAQLWTRGGEPINAPAWFTAGWPSVPLDGELWAGRGQFSLAVSTVRQHRADDAAWRKIRFMVFDLPAHGGNFDARILALQQLLPPGRNPWLQAAPQRRVASHRDLQALLAQTVQAGGEGLMLHRGASLYRGLRSNDLLKFKLFEDAEARVIGHLAGKGKYRGKLGALLVETARGLRFKLGAGLSDAERADPPPIGAWVSYRFRDLNPSGVPRFASFLRIREDLP